MGILKEGFLAYSSPVMLISRKLTKDKRVVTDFRHLNVTIAKNNLAYPWVRDTYSVLGNSKCESIRKVLFETELKFCSKVTSFHSQTWLFLLVCLGKCFPFEKPKDCCTIQFYYFPTYWYIFVLRCYRTC